LLQPPTHLVWAASHAALPIVEAAPGNRVRIYFSSRDAHNRAQIGRASLDVEAPASQPEFEPEPLVRIGPRGAFDDSGVTGGCIVEEGGNLYLYFSGWNLGASV